MLSSSYYLSLLLTASFPPSSQSSSLLLLPHSSPSTSSLPISFLPLSSSLPLFSFFLFSTYLPPCSPFLTTSLPYSSPSYSLPLSLLSLNPPPHYFSLIPLHPLSHYLFPSFLSVIISLIPLHPPPHYLSLSFSKLLTSSLPPSSVILTTALLPSSHSSSLLLSLIPIHPPHYLSPSFLSIILTTSLPPSSQSSSPPLNSSFLSIRHLITSSLFCNIIIHLITSVFLPSPSSLVTLPNYLLRILFSSVVIIILLITSSSLLLSSSFTFVTSSFLSSSFKSPLQYLFHYFLIIILLTISTLFHIDPLPNSSPSSSLLYTSSISPSSPSSFYHSPSVLSILLLIFLPSCPLHHTCQLCLPALSKLEFFSLALRKIALSLKCFSHPFLLPPYPFSLHVHACLSYYYHHC